MTERGRLICTRVARRVGEVAPRGLGGWDGVWEVTAGPSDEFLDRLAEWEARDAPDTRAALEAAVNEFVRAWRRAAEAWEAAGRPRGAASPPAVPSAIGADPATPPTPERPGAVAPRSSR